MSEARDAKEVLYIWPYLEWGGAQIYFLGIMKLARELYNVRAVMPRGTGQKLLGYLEGLGIPCEYFDRRLDVSPARTIWQKIRRRWRNAVCDLALAGYLTRRGLKGRILHIDIGPWSSFLLLLYLSLRSEVFVTLHIGLPQLAAWRRLIWKLKFHLLCAVPKFHLLVSNLDMLESLRPYVPEGYLSGIPLAYTGVDDHEIKRALEARLDRASLCEKYRLPEDRLFIFSLGQVIERKGCLVLLETVKQLRRQYPSLFFVWIGTGAQQQELERQIAEYGLDDAFRIITPDEIGEDRTDLLALLRLADIFAHPSFSEGLPGAMLEAMALGKACVATNVNAIPEAVKDHRTGLLVAPGDSHALATAIAELNTDPSLRARLAADGQKFVLENFNERATARVTIEMYQTFARAN